MHLKVLVAVCKTASGEDIVAWQLSESVASASNTVNIRWSESGLIIESGRHTFGVSPFSLVSLTLKMPKYIIFWPNMAIFGFFSCFFDRRHRILRRENSSGQFDIGLGPQRSVFRGRFSLNTTQPGKNGTPQSYGFDFWNLRIKPHRRKVWGNLQSSLQGGL